MTGRRRTGGRVADALDLFAAEPTPARSIGPADAGGGSHVAAPATDGRSSTRSSSRSGGRASTRRRGAIEDAAPGGALVAHDAADAATAYAPPAFAETTYAVDPYARTPQSLDLADAYAPDDAADVTAAPHAIPGATPAAAVPVALLTQTIKDVVEGAFVPLWVRGEVTDFKAHRNGHWYFSLRDASAQVRCVIWSRDARRLPAMPDDGMQVVALGQVGVYAARGDLQLSVKALQAEGDGLWRKALEQTRQRLLADGLLDPARRRPLPRFPRRVAVVTSPDGAALHDIVAVLRRRCPTVEVVVVAAKVQGDGAPEALCRALACVARWCGTAEAPDVVIVGRGGGAREDLWAFNDERLARAVAACPIPVISAVGHEVDVTICDLVADLRAATPSAAAEAVAPVLAELQAEVEALGAALRDGIAWQAERARERLDATARDLALAATRVAERRRALVETAAARLHALSPLATLGRGYAVARAADGRALARAASFAPGTPFVLQLGDGRVHATATRVEADPPSNPSRP